MRFRRDIITKIVFSRFRSNFKTKNLSKENKFYSYLFVGSKVTLYTPRRPRDNLLYNNSSRVAKVYKATLIISSLNIHILSMAHLSFMRRIVFEKISKDLQEPNLKSLY